MLIPITRASSRSPLRYATLRYNELRRVKRNDALLYITLRYILGKLSHAMPRYLSRRIGIWDVGVAWGKVVAQNLCSHSDRLGKNVVRYDISTAHTLATIG